MWVTYGALALFFCAVIWILQKSFVADRNFSDYAVGGRSFGPWYQTMSFLNTWYPGATFTAFAGLAAGTGVFSFYLLTYSLLTVVLMYPMATRVWTWGKRFDLATQSEFFSLRYDSHHIKALTAVIGIVSAFPWLVLGMQALGAMFHDLSLGYLSFTASVILAVAVMVVRQFWTIRMGMRGVVISDMFQGIVAYGGGSLLIAGLLIWLVEARGIHLSSLSTGVLSIPGFGSDKGSLYLFALIFSGAIGGWCWPSIFVRLFTADGVRSVKKAAVLALPWSIIFSSGLFFTCMLASQLPDVAAHPDNVWFTLSRDAGGLGALALAGVCVLAASMGNIDGGIQAIGAQVAGGFAGRNSRFTHTQLLVIAKLGMGVVTALAAWAACSTLPALFSLAVLSYQGIIQLAVPLMLGIFWRRGNRQGAIAGLFVGFVVTGALEWIYHGSVPWAHGLTSGVIGLAANFAIYATCAYLFPHSAAEQARLDELFDSTSSSARACPGSSVPSSAVAMQATQSGG
ncbi:sodium:solute symporter family protein [Paraburkholderia caffeinilytica]|uniref:sodium:solute symporter family protein n=1 Tax=Paraburkholderia caffeinilytica TaxID=1761016 RepID=UPI0038BB782A